MHSFSASYGIRSGILIRIASGVESNPGHDINPVALRRTQRVATFRCVSIQAFARVFIGSELPLTRISSRLTDSSTFRQFFFFGQSDSFPIHDVENLTRNGERQKICVFGERNTSRDIDTVLSKRFIRFILDSLSFAPVFRLKFARI